MRLYQFHHRQLWYKIHHIIIYLLAYPVLIPVTFNAFFQKFFCHFQIFCNLKPVLAAMLKGSYQSDQTDLLVVRPESCLTFLFSVGSRCHVKNIANGSVVVSEFFSKNTGFFCSCSNILPDCNPTAFDSTIIIF